MGAPGNVVVLDFTLRNGTPAMDVERSDSPDQDAFLTWDASQAPEAPPTFSVWAMGGGAAYLSSPRARDEPIKQRNATITSHRAWPLGKVRYSWNGTPRGDHGLFLILVLPRDRTVVDPVPNPIQAKEHDGRLVVIWNVLADLEPTVHFAWSLRKRKSTVDSEVKSLNRRFSAQRDRPSRASVLFRLALAALAAAVGWALILAVPRMAHWSWLDNHPNKLGLYAAAFLLWASVCWAAADEKRRWATAIPGAIATLIAIVSIIGR